VSVLGTRTQYASNPLLNFPSDGARSPDQSLVQGERLLELLQKQFRLRDQLSRLLVHAGDSSSSMDEHGALLRNIGACVNYIANRVPE
jgi:hypothetical protein